MPKRTTSFIPSLDRPLSPGSRQRGLYAALRQAILDRRLRAGARLPSTREMARAYGVSRGTAVAVYAQLIDEGYLRGRVGAGTFVNETLPDALLQRAAAQTRSAQAPAAPPRLARRARLLTHSPFPLLSAPAPARPFEAHRPALDVFPAALWARVASSRLRRLKGALLADASPLGYLPLREALVDYLGSVRGVRCEVEQVLIVSGTQQALDLASRLVFDPGDSVWVEDPGHAGTRQLLSAAGARVRPIPVDGEGLCVSEAERTAAEARLACVTPAHQAPLGVAMSLPRRLALLDWARRKRAWIFEDDYDSEYRYEGRPLPSLQSLDEVGCVLHAGSFSKTLFPALRLGYLVVPPALVEAFRGARSLTDRYPGIIPQAILADFLSEGHYARHIRRMREVYAERRQGLVERTASRLGGALRLSAEPAGLDLVGWLGEGLCEREVLRGAETHGVSLEPLSAYTVRARVPPGVVLGFAALPRRQMEEGVERLAHALEGLRQPRG
jgi:GntR family transcriptional regulator/MocR family aminotransferase